MELDKLQKTAIKNLIEHCKLMEHYRLGHLSSGEVKALTDLYVELDVELECLDLRPKEVDARVKMIEAELRSKAQVIRDQGAAPDLKTR